MRLVLATRNEHKLREFRSLLDRHEVVPLPDAVELPPETGETFEENARAKARAAADATGMPAFADDSGIAAAALDGRPGVRSARFAGEGATDEENLAKLLAEVPDGNRRVTYVCALAYAEPGGDARVFTERCEGELAREPRGSGGFGYDPGFVPVDRDDGRTMAELTVAEVPDGDRRVTYVCALAYAEPGGDARVFTERCEGELAREPRGGGGFGYDPGFVPVDRDDGRTMAELTVAEKDAISHRGRAARTFLEWLEGGAP